MKIDEVIRKVGMIKPTRSELESNIEDKDYIDYLLNCYSVDYENLDGNLSMLENLVLNTSFSSIDFAGITFNRSIDDLIIEGENLKVFAHFQENQLCFDESLEHFYFVDLYEPNSKPIVIKCPMVPEKFVDSMLKLMELDIGFTYRDKAIDLVEIENLVRIAGHAGFMAFFNIVMSQYE